MSRPMMLRPMMAVTLGTLLAAIAPLQRVHAQAFNYPSLQVPTASTRDYTAALVGGAGTTALFQWREGFSPRRHWQLDAGVTDRQGAGSLALFVGGGLAQELTRATGDQPLDLLVTAGAGLSVGGGSSVIRIPVGVSLGHTFALERGMTITPFAHPRASIDVCSSCGTEGRSESEISLNFDLGVNFQVNRQFAVRASGGFTGAGLVGGRDSFAVGFTWTPASLAGR